MINNTLVVKSGEDFQQFTVIKVNLNSSEEKFVTELVPITRKFAEDPEMKGKF